MKLCFTLFVFVLGVVLFGCDGRKEFSLGNELEPQSMEELLALSEADLERVDIGRMNLICARDHCAAIRSLTLEARHYDRMPTVDLLMDLVKRGNDKLQKTGYLPFGLIVTTRSEPMPTPSEVGPLDMPSLSIFDSLAYAARLVGLELGFRGKDLLVHP